MHDRTLPAPILGEQIEPPAPIVAVSDQPGTAPDMGGQFLLRGLFTFLVIGVIVIMFVGDLKSLLGW